MGEEHVRVQDVETVLATGETVEFYPGDTPYPSRLVLGWSEARPVHVVIGEQADGDDRVVITAYRPNPERWDATFRHRRPRR
jgi:hypothetical protein